MSAVSISIGTSEIAATPASVEVILQGRDAADLLNLCRVMRERLYPNGAPNTCHTYLERVADKIEAALRSAKA